MTYITRDDYKLDHNLTITCNQGYQPVGFVDIMCSNDTTWVPALPNCVLGINCVFSSEAAEAGTAGLLKLIKLLYRLLY